MTPVGVFKLKLHDMHSKGVVLKARYCANGSVLPKDGLEITANVASNAKLKLIMAMSVGPEWVLIQIDVKSALTQVKLGEDQFGCVLFRDFQICPVKACFYSSSIIFMIIPRRITRGPSAGSGLFSALDSLQLIACAPSLLSAQGRHHVHGHCC